MRFLSLLFFAILCALAVSSVRAQTSAPTLTVEHAVAVAIRQNPRLLASAHDMEAAALGVRAAQAPANPEITFTPAITGPGGSDTEFLAQQPLEINGARRARTGVAAAQFRVTQAGAIIDLRNLVFQTKSAYFELQRAREQQDVAQALLKSAKDFDQITRQQVEAGSRPGIDKIQTGIEVTRANQQLTQANRQVLSAEAELNTFMGQSPSNPIGTLEALPRSVESVSSETVLPQALTSRAEILQEEANRDVFLQQGRAARAEGIPDLVPQVRAGSVTRGSIQDSGIGIGITLPLFDSGSRRNRLRQSEQSAQAQELRLDAVRAQIRQEVTLALSHVQAANAIIGDYQTGILDQAQQLLDASRTGFKEGQTNIVAVLEAQRTYRAVQIDYINALVDAAIAHAELERAAGSVSVDLLPK